MSAIGSYSRSFTPASSGILAVFAVCAWNYQPASLRFPQKSLGGGVPPDERTANRWLFFHRNTLTIAPNQSLLPLATFRGAYLLFNNSSIDQIRQGRTLPRPACI
jgi:hypothetical protein